MHIQARLQSKGGEMMKLRILKAIIRTEEWLIKKFSPYMDDGEMQEYRDTVERHKKAVE